jgi:1-acyl-sn-glycerol-3-phosphate acyltransferase
LILYRVIRATLAPVLRRIVELRVEGLERLPPGPCVLAPNHDSLSDPFFVGAAIPRPLRMLGKAELFRFPLRPVLLSLGAIPVVRGEGDVAAIAAVVEAVRGGATVVIHPQGTVLGAPDRRWRRGAARVALETGVPLVPVALVGTERVLRPGTTLPRRAAVRVVVCEPIAPGAARAPTEDEASALTERVRLAVEAVRRPASGHG